MNRRQFLRSFGLPIAAAIAVPELARTIILPPRGGWPMRLGVGHNDLNVVYAHQSYAMGFAVTKDHERYLTSGTRWFLDPKVADGLKRYWRESYDLGPLLEDGTRGAPFSESWANIYADA